jgi:hypothetical protein
VQDDYESKSAVKNAYQAAAPASFSATEQRRAHPIVAQPAAHYGGSAQPSARYGGSAQPAAQYGGSAQPEAEGRQEPHTFGGGYAFEFSG